jgi:hypothetical protein
MFFKLLLQPGAVAACPKSLLQCLYCSIGERLVGSLDKLESEGTVIDIVSILAGGDIQLWHGEVMCIREQEIQGCGRILPTGLSYARDHLSLEDLL